MDEASHYWEKKFQDLVEVCLSRDVAPGRSVETLTEAGILGGDLSLGRQPRGDALQMANETNLLEFHAIGAQPFIPSRNVATHKTGIHDSTIPR